MKVSAIVNPTNVRTANYTITLNIRSQGKLASRFSYAKSLSLNNPVSLSWFIPLKVSELDKFDSVDITYEKLLF